jgi:hypothetical protein
MKKGKLFVVVVVLLLLVGLIAITSYTVFNQEEQKPFYVGVTYGGSSVQEAKELIDQVKNYTNLFILASGTMQNATAAEEIGNYVIASGLNFIVYTSENVHYGERTGRGINEWANSAKERWKEQFIGIYYRDESGGEMLDGKKITLEKTTEQINGETIIIQQINKAGNIIEVYNANITQGNRTFSSTTMYVPISNIYGGGESILIRNVFKENNNNQFVDDSTSSLTNYTVENPLKEEINYYRDGRVEIIEYVTETDVNYYLSENITKYPWPIQSYEQVLKQKPIQTHDDAANAFVNMNKEFLTWINKEQLSKESILVFTADYGLYWWDYQSGYDVVFAELGWNNTITQQISLVRGAATLQNKQWGTILTWTYTHPPYLTNGEDMFEQMKTSYEAGANYVIVFNYTEDLTNPNCLQEEHFQAIERFWNDVVQNPKAPHGSIKADTVLVLPKNYGWGMRNPNDNIWGLWPTDNNSQEIWNQTQNKINQHELKLDIIFEDPNYPPLNYKHIHYWNQK